MKLSASKRMSALFFAFVLIISSSLGLASDEAVIKPLFSVALSHDLPEAKSTFEEIKALILANYYSPTLTENALYYAAIRGMLRHVSPPEHPDLAMLWTPDQYAQIVESLKGEQVSIGIRTTFNPLEGALTVSEVIPDSPADMVLKPLDRILRINGESLAGKKISQLSELLDGPEGSQVTLTVNRDIQVFEVTLKRQKVATQNLEVTLLDSHTAVMELKKFTSGIAEEMKRELDKLALKGVSRLVLDLRANGGGVFEESLKVAELFLPLKTIMIRIVQKDSKVRAVASSNPDPYKFSMAILTGMATASSSEVIAAALQDNGRAFLVGGRTYGKGVFETTFSTKSGYKVKFITGAMYSPKGRSWQTAGLLPDFLADTDERTTAALLKIDPKTRYPRDVALITAVKLLTR